MTKVIQIVERRTWRLSLQTYTIVITDGSGIGKGAPVWVNEMRIRCVESDDSAGFWRYEVGLYSVVIVRIVETGAFTTSIQYAHDRFPLSSDTVFHASHDNALSAAQARIRRDGRGTSQEADVYADRTSFFPCPYDVFPDAVRIERTGRLASTRLRNADPLERTSHRCEDVESLYDAICNLKPAEDGIYHGSPGWGVYYHLTFSQNGSEALRLTASPTRPEFLYRSGDPQGRAYWTDERFWTAMATVLDVAYDELFPAPQP